MADGTDPADGRAIPAATPAGPLLDVAAFCCELAMLTVLGFAGWGLGNGGLMGIAFTIFYPALAVLVWSIWVAPRSLRRLPDPARLTLQLVLFAATGTLSAAAGHAILGVVFAVIACAAFVAARFTGGVTGG